MRFLLDTHVVLWLAGDASEVPAILRDALAEAEARFISSASAMEIALKTRLGKLPDGKRVLDGWSTLLAAFLAQELPLTVPHMMRAGGMEWAHRDPFDRMLVAQAQLEGLRLVTSDRRLREYGDVLTDWG